MIFKRFPATAGALVSTSAIVVVLTGCQTYKPAPLDLGAHIESWRKQTTSKEEVASFASNIARVHPNNLRDFNPSDGLSFAEGEIISLVFNPELRIARLQAGVAQATAENAGRWKDPNFNLTLLNIAEDLPDPWFVSSGLSLTIPISGRLVAERKRAQTALNTAF